MQNLESSNIIITYELRITSRRIRKNIEKFIFLDLSN